MDRVRVAAMGDVHCTNTSGGELRPVFDAVSRAADVLLLCGDLTDYGRAEERLAEVRQRRPGKAADEALRPDDADVEPFDLSHGRVAIENGDPATAQGVRDLVRAAEVMVVVPEDGVDGREQARARVGEDGRLLRVAVGGQVAGEEDQVGLAVDLREGGLDLLAMRLARVDVAGGRDPDRPFGSVHGGPPAHDWRPSSRGSSRRVASEDEFERLVASARKVSAILRDADIPHALAGGLAAWARGGPKTEHDVDFMVMRDDADEALEALARAGLRTERPPEGWLYKGYDGDILVDLIFTPSSGPVTDELLERAEVLELQAMPMRVARLEDVMVTKLMALTEQEPDFGGVLEIARSLREQIDWNEVRARTADSPFAAAFFTLLVELQIVTTAS